MSAGWRRAAEIVAGACALVAAVVWLSGGCGERIGPEGEPSAATTAPPEAAIAVAEAVVEPVLESASGTVASARQTTVSSKILARISEIRVRAGSVVEAGEVVVLLDDRDLRARLAEAREQLRGARASFELAGTELARIRKLVAADVASQQQLDRARSSFRVAEAEVEAAQQRVADAEVGLSHAEIHSPVSGRVVDRLAEPGDTAAPGVPLLRIYDPGALRLEAPVRETLAVTLSPGQALDVEIEALGRRLRGTIDEIVPFAEPGARTLLVKVRLPDDEPRLFAGMFGRVEIPAGERHHLHVPHGAVARVGQLEFATAVRADGTLERRLVTTGLLHPETGELEILSGLSAGERVLLEPRAP